MCRSAIICGPAEIASDAMLDIVHELKDVGGIVAVVRHLAHGGKDPAYPDQPGDLARFLDNVRAARHGALIFYFMRHAWFK